MNNFGHEFTKHRVDGIYYYCTNCGIDWVYIGNKGMYYTWDFNKKPIKLTITCDEYIIKKIIE